MITVNRSFLVHMKNEQTVKPLDKALDIKPLRALPWFLGCVGTAAWAAYMKALNTSHGLLPKALPNH